VPGLRLLAVLSDRDDGTSSAAPRRALLRAAALAPFLTRLARGATDEPPRRAKRPIRRCLKFGMIGGEGSVADKFDLLQELGYDGVEIDSPSGLDLDEVIAARDRTGLVIPGVVDSVHWQHTLGDPDADVRAKGLAALETAIDDCARVGGTTVLLVPAVVNARIPYDLAWSRSQAEIRKVLPRAKDRGVRIAFENVWNDFLLSPLEAARYVDEFESESVGFYFDVGNVVNYGYPEQWVRILGKRILKLDFKEFSRKKRDAEGLWKGFAVEMLEGDCGWPEVMAALDEIGYSGFASAEVGGGGRERLRDILARMDRILAL
jgi:L-ribulose-5-phosphate 3-epimerase